MANKTDLEKAAVITTSNQIYVDAFNSQKAQVAHNLVVAVTTVAKQCCLLPNI